MPPKPSKLTSTLKIKKKSSKAAAGLFPIRKIISGGQTGADRAALDFAIEHGIPHGGWCPAGRWAEDGKIDARYRLKQTPSSLPAQRTKWNVRDSDATVIFSIRKRLSGGTKLTRDFAQRFHKPYIHLSRDADGKTAARKLRAFLKTHSIRILNIAGPRQSSEPKLGIFTYITLKTAFLNR